MQYPNFRGTLAKIREKTTLVLPTTINNIIFESEEYYKYTRTEEDKLFLQFDNIKTQVNLDLYVTIWYLLATRIFHKSL